MADSDPIIGCILGGALGDAMGRRFENLPPQSEISADLSFGISDDTQLTLATCEALVEYGGRVEPAAIAARLAAWFREGRINGIGASTHKALHELGHGGHWALVGRKGEMAAGNGAAMRIAPLAFCLDPRTDSGKRTLRDVARITHHNEEAYSGALAVAIAIHETWVLEDHDAEPLLHRLRGALPDTALREQIERLADLPDDRSLADIGRRFGCSGHVVESVPLALLGAQRARTLGFEAMLLGLIAAGGDADTIASLAGQVAGTHLGYQHLPMHLLEQLPEKELVLATAQIFAAEAAANR